MYIKPTILLLEPSVCRGLLAINVLTLLEISLIPL